MYDDLTANARLSAKECCVRYKISLSTFHRYLADLREFAWESKGEEIVYDAESKTYSIAKNKI